MEDEHFGVLDIIEKAVWDCICKAYVRTALPQTMDSMILVGPFQLGICCDLSEYRSNHSIPSLRSIPFCFSVTSCR